MIVESPISGIVADIIKIQRQEFDKGNTDNIGASIDAMALIQKLASHDRYRGIATAGAILREIQEFDALYDALKYAKPLTKFTQTGAYHIVRSAIFAK